MLLVKFNSFNVVLSTTVPLLLGCCQLQSQLVQLALESCLQSLSGCLGVGQILSISHLFPLSLHLDDLQLACSQRYLLKSLNFDSARGQLAVELCFSTFVNTGIFIEQFSEVLLLFLETGSQLISDSFHLFLLSLEHHGILIKQSGKILFLFVELTLDCLSRRLLLGFV